MDRSIAVLYGSETGNAHDYSETLAATLERFHFKVLCSSLDDFDLRNLVHIKVLIVICSTTGQGEFPKNAQRFWKFMLKKKLPPDLLNHLIFTTFGLGDSSYPKFNWAIKKLHNRLLQLGAVEFSKRAESDEQSSQGIDGYYVEFQKLLIEKLIEKFPIPNGLEPIPENQLLPPKNKLVVDMRKPKRLTDQEIKQVALSREHSDVIHAIVACNKRITSEDHFQDVRHFSITTKNEIMYQPGDTISLYPTNDRQEVQALIEMQGWQNIADRRIALEGEVPNIDGGFIKNMTLRSLLTHHLDLRAIPRRSFFGLLQHFASDDREREKLQEFSSYKDPEELYNYANRPRRSILEVIQEFFSVKIPVEYIFDLFPFIRPRLFSISSPPSTHHVDLTIAIVQYKTVIRRIRKGLCTSWIKNLEIGDEIIIKVNHNSVKFPPLGRPIIMISPGTGIAPMRSLIQQRVSLGCDKSQLILFTGNRFRDKDFLYGEELTQLEQQGKLTLFTAFSRQAGGYVQDVLYMQAEEIVRLLIYGDATIYICGSSGKMPTQVRMTFETILEESRLLTKEEAIQYLLQLEVNYRYIQETW
jgi:sulfite reductase alpha subunit-like flavoprotein